jgi:hypothetical protein
VFQYKMAEERPSSSTQSRKAEEKKPVPCQFLPLNAHDQFAMEPETAQSNEQNHRRSLAFDQHRFDYQLRRHMTKWREAFEAGHADVTPHVLQPMDKEKPREECKRASVPSTRSHGKEPGQAPLPAVASPKPSIESVTSDLGTGMIRGFSLQSQDAVYHFLGDIRAACARFVEDMDQIMGPNPLHPEASGRAELVELSLPFSPAAFDVPAGASEGGKTLGGGAEPGLSAAAVGVQSLPVRSVTMPAARQSAESDVTAGVAIVSSDRRESTTLRQSDLNRYSQHPESNWERSQRRPVERSPGRDRHRSVHGRVGTQPGSTRIRSCSDRSSRSRSRSAARRYGHRSSPRTPSAGAATRIAELERRLRDLKRAHPECD